jgi:GAF domain-containing protein
MDEAADGTELRRLRALHGSGLLAGPGHPGLDEACRQAREHFCVATAMVTLLDREVQVVRALAGAAVEDVPRCHAFCDHTIRADDVHVVGDAARDPRFASNPLVLGAPFIRFYAGAPLIYRRGIRLGALCLLDPAPREFSLGDRAELALMAEEVVSGVLAREVDDRAAGLGLSGSGVEEDGPGA